MMQAPAHPRPEKEAECGERPAPEGATERGRPSPGSRERQAPGPEPSPGPRHPRPGQRLAPRPPRSPSHPARSPLGAGGGPKRRAEWGGRRVPGKGCCLPAPPSPPPPGRAGSGRWAAGEGRSPRVEDRGAEDAAPTPLGRRNFSKPARAGDRGWGKPGALPNSTVAGRTKPESSSKIDAPLINGPSRNPCCTFQIPRDAWDLPPSYGFVSSENSEQLLCVLRLSSGPGYCPIICLILILPIFLTFFSPLTYFSEGVSVADTDARTPPPAVSCVLGQQPPALRVEAASSLRSRGCSSRGSCSQIANTATVQGLASLPTAESLLRRPLGRDSVDSES